MKKLPIVRKRSERDALWNQAQNEEEVELVEQIQFDGEFGQDELQVQIDGDIGHGISSDGDELSSDGDDTEKGCMSDDSCDVNLVDEENEIQGDDAELNITMPIPSTKLDMASDRKRMNFIGTRERSQPEVMGYSFDVDSEYEDSDDFESLDEDSDEEKERFPKFNIKTDMVDPKFLVGMIFPSLKVLKEAVQRYSIKNRRAISFKKNDLSRLRVICKNGCPWTLYATPIQGGNKVQIRTFKDQHACCKVFKNKYATYVWVAYEYLETIRENPSIPLSALQMQVKKDTSFTVPTTKLWRAKKLAFKLLRGNEEQQFLKLADYGGELKNTNPGSTLILSLDNLVFKKVFVCISGCKNGFKAGCRPIINIDGCFLKGRYGGQLLAAVGIDPNDCIWPIAYAVVDVECRETWTWFLQLLGEELGIENSHNWTFMSDRQKGLIQAVGTLYPNAEHRFCVRHLIANFKKTHPGESLKNAVWGAATSTYMGEYKQKMETIKDMSVDAWAWMEKIPAAYWSRSHFRLDSKCDILLNNISECFNRFILDARDKPILTMLEIIRCKIMVRIAKKREKMSNWSGNLCPKIKKKLEKIKEDSKHCWPMSSGGTQFQVSCPAGQFVVDVATRTCSCRKWQLTGIPCTHACATLAYNDICIEDYVDPCYSISVCNAVYGNIINPIRSMDQWEDVHHNPIQPPNSIPPKRGRPKKKRRREHGEKIPSGKMKRIESVMHCSQCGQSGHNKRGCKNSSPVSQTSTIGSSRGGSSRGSARAFGGRGRTLASAGRGGMGIYYGDEGEMVFRSAANCPGVVIRDIQSQP